MKHDNRRKTVEANRSFFRPAATLIAVFAFAGCSEGGTTIGGAGGFEAGGAPGSGGAGKGGSVAAGGVATGGSTGGSVAAGGLATGGSIAAGGAATGGASTARGGASAGGTSPAGGAATGGGANPAGGAATGGKSAGGATTVGGTQATAGKSATGGTAAGGATSTVGGAAAGGGASPTGGAATGYPENTGANCVATAAAMLSKKNPKLPDPFAMHDGTRISTKAQWECRRNEIKKDIEKYEIGTKPEPPTVAATLSGSTLSVKVTTTSGTMTITSTVSGSGSCVVIGMNGNSSMVSGCTQVPFMHDQVLFEDQNASRKQTDPFYKVYPDMWNKSGNYNGWSWGISRLIDGLEQVKDQLKIDMTKIAVHGCSYAGKMALFAGALDERVALTIAQESGGGGITSWRTSQDFTTRTGTNIEKIDNTNYSWFMSSMKTLDPYSLPHDHHELIAMIAPRAIIALGNPGYEWLGDESGYKSIMAAKEVFKAMGVEDRIGFDFTGGHNHCAAAASQSTNVNAFVDKFLKAKTATTTVAIKPSASNFDLDHTKVIDWTTPTLQ